MPLTAGQLAPEFTLQDETGTPRSLSDFRGKVLVLYFYPKDDTPGCTMEACNFRDDYSAYEEAGASIPGVRPYKPQINSEFKVKYGLPFSLLADTERTVCQAYGVWGRKKLMGREYDGVLRTTYLINPDGLISRVFENVRSLDHSEQILAALTDGEG